MLERGKAPTFLQSAFANEVLKCLNALIRFRVVPAAAGKVVPADDAFVIDLTPMQAATQAAQISAIQKLQASQQAQINALIASLKNATISAACNPSDSTITVTIMFPKLP